MNTTMTLHSGLIAPSTERNRKMDALKQLIKSSSLWSIGVLLTLAPILGWGAVGKTPGSFQVSSGGTANYTIPIWAPPGPRGLQPSLALVYDQHDSGGTVGSGWSLAGLSSITRCSKTLVQDGVAAPVTLTYNDAFCLDGQRLRLASSDTLSTYGQDGTTYLAEINGFSLVTAHGVQGNGPSYFTVRGKNGLTYEYGNGSNSLVMATGTSTASAWLLDKITDRAGNVMAIAYLAPSSTLSGTSVPTSISWTPTSHGSSSYSYTMNFAYTTNMPQSSIIGYVSGTAVVNEDLLTNISIRNSSSTTIKQYVLNYDTAPTTGRYRLSTVKECADAAATDCLLPTTITYQAGAAGVSTTSSSFTFGSGMNWYLANYDLNGDGYKDLLYQLGSTWYVAFGSSTGYGSGYNTGVSTSGSTVYPGDFLGKGRDGFLAKNGTDWWYYAWNGSAFAGTDTHIVYDTSASSFALADTNGDGLADLVSLNVVANSSLTAYIRLNTGAGTSVSFGAPTAAYSLSNGNLISAVFTTPDAQQAGSVRYFDFNGDGIQDIALIVTFKPPTGILRWTTYELLGSGSTFSSVVMPSAPHDVPPLFVQWNNDACTDYVTDSTLVISACNGTVGATISLSYTPLTTIDWDGDGRSDLVYGAGSTLSVQLSSGQGLGSTIATSIPWNTAAAYRSLDVNADGLDDLGAWNASALTYYRHNGAGQPPDLLTGITDGYGISVSPQYTSIMLGSYSNSPNATNYPEQDVHDPLYVVSNVTQSDGVGGTFTQTYSYVGARRNVQGRGFEGYELIGVSDSRSASLVTKTTYQQAYPYTGMVLYSDTYQHDGVTFVSHVSYTNQDTVLHSTSYNDRHFPHVQSSTVQAREVGGSLNGALIATMAQSNTFDSFGNLTNVVTTVTDNDSTSPNLNQQWTTTTATTFASADTSANWCVNVPLQTTVTKSATGVAAITRTTAFDSAPDYTNCRINRIVTEPSSPTYAVTKALTYDAFGNISAMTVTGAGMAARMASVDWGTTGQFPVNLRDPLSNSLGASGYKTVKGYDYNLGLQTSEVIQSIDGSANNAPATGWQYDTFGRKKLETRPNGTSTDWVYQDCASTGGCLYGTDAMVVSSHIYNVGGSLQTDSTTYFDQLDRPVATSQRQLSGAYNRVDSLYDNFGRLQRQSMPCSWTAVSVYCTNDTNYSYDALGRMTSTWRPISDAHSGLQTTTVQYAGRTTITTDPYGKTATKIVTVGGTLFESKDQTGYYQLFGYDAFGSLLSVTDNLSQALFTATYDYGVRAFQRDVTDMDLDRSTASGQHRRYVYNALGEVTSWSDANGQSFSATYDALSRPLTRIEPDLTSTWTWGQTASNHDVGKLTVTSAGGYTETFTYDVDARLSGQSVTIPSDFTYSYGLTYNATTGFLDTLTYPSTPGFASPLKLSYQYQNGIQFKVTDANTGTIYWQANTTNPRGQITQETLGNGVVTSRTFDTVTGWPSAITSGLSGTAALQNEGYLYDEMGNVTQRQNNNAGLTENFYYDDVYRLDHSTLNGVANLQMGYNIAGNITSRSDVAGGATWAYDPVHKHAVTQAGSGGYTYTYDANGNATSRNGLGITWTSYNHPLTINSSGTGESVYFAYNQNHERWKAVLSSGSGTETTYFIGDLVEKVLGVGATDFRHYIYAGGIKVAINSRTTSGVNTLHYIREDQQGGVAAILNSDGTSYVKESFTAFGTRRNACTWSGSPTNGQMTKINAVTRHGYTWQTALGAMGLNDMNGRIQDAVTGRFLSADPTAPNISVPQDFNRYSYVHNNPLTFTDPTGMALNSPKCRDTCPPPGMDLARCSLSRACASAFTYGTDPETTSGVLAGNSLEGITAADQTLGSLETVIEGSITFTTIEPSNSPEGGDAASPVSANSGSGSQQGGQSLQEVTVTGQRDSQPIGLLPIGLQQVGSGYPYNVNLLAHELQGGHTWALHIGKSASFLQRRFGGGSDGVASTFSSLASATYYVNMTLNANAAGVDTWMSFQDDPEVEMDRTLVFQQFSGVTGFAIPSWGGAPVAVHSVMVILDPPRPGLITPEGFLIRTAYPTFP